VQPAPVQVMTIHQSKGLEFDAVDPSELESRLNRQRFAVLVVFERRTKPGRSRAFADT